MENLLTKEQREGLENLHRKIKDRKSCDKIKTMLMLDVGYSTEEISRVLLIDKNTVSNWKKRFRTREPIEAWLTDSYKKYIGKLKFEAS
ncbi:MAG: helix-turn-helix domain-containing protein [Ignavibacteria bacterium]|jgi:transposase-like protein